jgi:ABC-type dipeptide/oligopeptide/nickel transport system ATPase component
MRENILNIEDLSIWYRTYRGYSKVVDHINLQVGKGEKIGLVGESGCGKTTTMKTVMGVLGKDLIHVPDGKIDFAGNEAIRTFTVTTNRNIHDFSVPYVSVESSIYNWSAADRYYQVFRSL